MEEVEDSRIMELVSPFFLENSFYGYKNTFKNNKCKVTIDLEQENYIIEWKNNYMVSENLSLHFVIGVLVCEGLIDRDFKWKN